MLLLYIIMKPSQQGIKISDKNYSMHPVYDLYAASDDGSIINVDNKIPLKGHKSCNGYMKCLVRKNDQMLRIYYVHRFVWECFNEAIPRGKVIDHINDIKDDNRLSNLQLLSQKENNKKSAKNRDYSFVVNNHINKKFVKAIDCSTDEVTYYDSMYAVQQNLGINAGIVKMVCEGTNHCKTGISKKNGVSYKFEYVDKEDMPDDYIKSSRTGEKRRRLLTDEEKWSNRTFVCRCGRTMLNKNKNYHKQNCIDLY